MNDQLQIWYHEKILELLQSGADHRTATRLANETLNSLNEQLPTRRHVRTRHLMRTTMRLEEIQQLINHYPRGHHYRSIWLLMSTCGFRPGEVVGQKNPRRDWKLPRHGMLIEYCHDDFQYIEYPILKPKITERRKGRVMQSIVEEKWRRVKLPPGTRAELLEYIRQQELNGMIYFDHERNTWQSRHPHGKLFPVKNSTVLDTEFSKLRQLFKGSWLELETEEETVTGESLQLRYRCRPHKLRHFYLTRSYYQQNCDLVATMREIGHAKIDITFNYTHSAKELGTTAEDLKNKTWEELLKINCANNF